MRVDVGTGNDRYESVLNVQAMLILPDGATLTSEVNPVSIGTMGPGPAHATCNWTMLFDQAGTYTVSVNVSCTDTQRLNHWLMNSTTVEVYGSPHVEFTCPENVYAHRAAVFNATRSYSLMPSETIVSYQWNFGDGTSITASSPVAEHTFNAVGNFTVLLNITDGEGLSSVTGQNVRTRLFGDVNLDDAVNILDVSIMALSYGSHAGDEKWNAKCDLNNDNVINILDLSLVAVAYGTSA